MIVSLANGKQVEIPTIMFLQMTDDEWNAEMDDLFCKNFGTEQEDPFYLSSFTINEKSTSIATDALEDEIIDPFEEIDYNVDD